MSSRLEREIERLQEENERLQQENASLRDQLSLPSPPPPSSLQSLFADLETTVTPVSTHRSIHSHVSLHASIHRSRLSAFLTQECSFLRRNVEAEIETLTGWAREKDKPIITKRVQVGVDVLRHQVDLLASDLHNTPLGVDKMTITPFQAAQPSYLLSLPSELVHYVVFDFDLSAADVLALALTSHHFYSTILGPLGNESEYDVNQLRAKGGVTLCMKNHWVRAMKIALKRGYCTPADLILDENCGETWYDLERVFPFSWAARRGYVDIIKGLLKYPFADPGLFEGDAVNVAVRRGHDEIVKVLLADRRMTSRLPFVLVNAAEEGNTRFVGLLLANPAVDPSASSNLALTHAAMNGHIDVVRLLLAHPRLDSNMKRAFRFAREQGHTNIMALLQSHAPAPLS